MSGTDWIIVGLGNPGREYEHSRHNIGFFMLDSFARSHKFSLANSKWQGRFCRQRFANKSVLMLKPQTYMNRSGACVVRFCAYYKVAPERLLVLHDDIDLELGRIKIVAGGGAGGHNGVRSISRHLATNDFARVKIGIGRPNNQAGSAPVAVERFVLARFSNDEIQVMQDRQGLIFAAIEICLAEGVAVAMNRINGRT